jgi:hydroxymethylglutaryl-CoA lyase
MSKPVEVIDVTLRDGLQNEPKPISAQQKLTLIGKLVSAGVTRIQATSFVHPQLVPQMADAETVASELSRFPDVRFSALVPNRRGYERAVAAGLKHLEFVMAASESFNRKNINCSIEKSLELLGEVSRTAERDGVELRVGLATSFHCPFEGTTPLRALVSLVRSARERGPWPVALSDTDGMAFPDQVKGAVAAIENELNVKPDEIVLHFHDTYGRGLANTLAGLDAGVRAFDAAAGGLGGCPFCPGASGNLATEDLVAFLDGMGYETGIDLDKLLEAAESANRFSSRPYQAHLLRARRPTALGGKEVCVQAPASV